MATTRPIRIALLILLVLAIPAGIAAENSISAGVGYNFYRYETGYLTALSATWLQEIQEGLEINLGAEFGITTDENADGETVPSFLIPVNLGLNFTFPREKVRYIFGTGLTPVFNFNPETDDEFRFLMGPYLKGAFRLRVHPIMSWYVEYQQDLLIGGDDWINAASRITTGINFTLGTE